MEPTKETIIDYTRCHHKLISFMKKRCQTQGLQCNICEEHFSIFQNHKYASFIKADRPGIYIISDRIEIRNEHLLGLQNPSLLFPTLTCLQDIHKKFGFGIAIIQDEIKLSKFQNDTKTQFSEDILSDLDLINEEFSFQLLTDGIFVINRCLKISSTFLMIFIQHKAMHELLRLTALYKACFLIAPVCGRMQSLALNGDFEPWENIYYIDIAASRETLKKIVKCLFPFIQPSFFDKKYFDVIPVELLNFRNPNKLLDFFNSCVESKVSVNFLRSGQIIRFDNILDVKVSLIFVLPILETIRGIRNIQPTVNFYKAGDYIEKICSYESREFIQNKKVTNISFHPPCKICDTNSEADKLIILGTLPLAVTLQDYEKIKDAKDLNVSIACFGKHYGPDALPLSFTQWYFNDNYHYNENDMEYVVLNERFSFAKNNLHIYDVKVFVHALEKLEEEEGLCFWYHRGVILHVSIADNNDFDSTILYHSKCSNNQLTETFNDLESLLSEFIFFEISYDGCIVFDDNCKISPITLGLIRNKNEFIKAMMIFCNFEDFAYPQYTRPLMSIGTSENDTFVMNIFKHNKNFWEVCEKFKKLYVQIARLLNKRLKHVPEELFHYKRFNSIPSSIFYCIYQDEKRIQKLSEDLQYLEAFKIGAIIENNMLTFKLCCSFFLNSIIALTEIRLVKDLYGKLQTIRTIHEQWLYVNNNDRVRVINERIHWKKWQGITNMSEPVIDQFVKCIDLIEKQKELKVRIDFYGFYIGSVTHFIPPTLLSIKEECLPEFFQAMNLLKRINFYLSLIGADHWKNWVSESAAFKEAGGFSILNNDENVYTKIIKKLQPFLNYLPHKSLASLQNIELLPNTLFVEKPENFLQKLEIFEDNECEFVITEDGNFLCDTFTLNYNQLMTITNFNLFKNITSMLKELYYEKVSKTPYKNVSPIQVLSSGFILTEKHSRDVEERHVYPTTVHMKCGKTCFAFLMNKLVCIKPFQQMKFTMNSDRDIMFGNYLRASYESLIRLQAVEKPEELNLLFQLFHVEDIKVFKEIYEKILISEPENKQSYHNLYNNKSNLWKFSTDILQTNENFIKIIENLNLIFKQNDIEEKMQSIYDLPELPKAIKTSKLMNEALEYFPDDLLKSEFLRTFPTFLWTAWKTNPSETHAKVENAFKQLKENHIAWFLYTNGNLKFEESLFLTMEQLLCVDSIDKLVNLIKTMKSVLTQLICVDHVKNDKNDRFRLRDTLIDPMKTVEAKTKAEEFKPGKNSVGYNGALFFNETIWVRPEDFVENAVFINQINDQLLEIFGGDKNFSFVYGTWNQSVLPPAIKSDEEKFYYFSQHLCNAFKAKNVFHKYDASKKEFIIYDSVYINPIKLFHLRDINSLIDAAKKYAESEESDEEKEKRFIKEYYSNQNYLQALSNKEDIEFNYIRKNCLQQVGELLWTNKKIIANFLPNIEEQMVDNKYALYNVEELEVNGNKIFKVGSLKKFLVKHDKFEINKNIILIALKLAASKKERYYCPDLIAFSSIVQIVNEYCKGRKVIDGKMIRTISFSEGKIKEYLFSPEAYRKMVVFLDEEYNKVDELQQQDFLTYKFANTLKGLHHWIKHGEDFENLHDYYIKMNEYFNENQIFNLQTSTKNGLKLSRVYETETHKGVLLVSHEHRQLLYATTFYMKHTKKNKPKNARLFNTLDPKNLTPYLIFTDFALNVKIRDEISVEILPKKFVTRVINKLTKDNNVDAKNVKKILILCSNKDALEEFQKKWKNVPPKNLKFLNAQVITLQGSADMDDEKCTSLIEESFS